VAIALGLALGPAAALGLARFAYALLLPSMRTNLGWSFSAAGAMSTANAVGYLAGAAARYLLRRWGCRHRRLRPDDPAVACAHGERHRLARSLAAARRHGHPSAWGPLLARLRGGRGPAAVMTVLTVGALLPLLWRSTPTAFASAVLFGGSFLTVVAAVERTAPR
jgi:hypothetical protein